MSALINALGAGDKVARKMSQSVLVKLPVCLLSLELPQTCCRTKEHLWPFCAQVSVWENGCLEGERIRFGKKQQQNNILQFRQRVIILMTVVFSKLIQRKLKHV